MTKSTLLIIFIGWIYLVGFHKVKWPKSDRDSMSRSFCFFIYEQ